MTFLHGFVLQAAIFVFPLETRLKSCCRERRERKGYIAGQVGSASRKFGDCICTDYFSSSSGRALMIDIMGSTGYLNG